MRGQTIIDYLRNQEVSEPELRKIYDDFEKAIHKKGFDEGCDFIRGVIRRQRCARQNSLQVKLNEFLVLLEDYNDSA